MNNPKFQMYKSTNNMEYYYRLRSKNAEIILNGEGYKSKQACLNGINAVKVNAPFDSRYDRKTATNGQYYFTLKAANGEVIGVSETYLSIANRENGIEAVKRDAPIAGIEDLA